MASQHIDKVALRFPFSVGAAQTFASTAVDIVNDTITITDHGFKTGDVIGILAGTTIPTGLTEATTGYYVILVDAHKFKVATSRANAQAGTAVDITGVGAGTNTVHKNGAGIVQLGVLPDNFVITDAWVDVVTTFISDDGTTPGNDAGTIALSTGQGAGDLKAAIAISDASNVWDAGIRGTLITAPNLGADSAHDSALEVIALEAGVKLKMTADRIVIATIATETLTAGSLDLCIEGYQGR